MKKIIILIISLLFVLNIFSQIELQQVIADDTSKYITLPKTHDEPLLQCLVAEPEMFYYVDPGSITISNQILNCVHVYIETDLFTYQAFGSNEQAVKDWATHIFDQSAIILANEGITIILDTIVVITNSSDNWSGAWGDVSNILTQFGLTRANEDYDHKHFITRRSLGGGIAWVGTLCWNQGPGSSVGPYAVSANMSGTTPDYPTYSWNVEVFTHEMGHNLGSPHTHSCVWGPNDDMAVDDCIGNTCDEIQPIEYSTVMSYCHLKSQGIDFTKGFGTEPGDLIRAAVSNAGCLQECCPEELVLEGDVSGIHIANKITLNQTSNIGDVTLDAKEITIQDSEMSPIYTMQNNGCN